MNIDDVMKHFTPPFRWTAGGYVTDDEGRTVAQARGYGHLCNCVGNDACSAVDTMARFIVDCLNAKAYVLEKSKADAFLKGKS